MVDLCSILHHKRTGIQDMQHGYVSSERLLELCIHADKYGCSAPLTLAVEGLLSRFLHGDELKPPCKNWPSLVNLAAAAYILRLGPHFKQCTRTLVLNVPRQYSELVRKRADEVLPLLVICKCYLPTDIKDILTAF